ncbi:MAG TPA: glycosyltransferase family 39 protein [Candidatus Baltobacteraceae bacterium]
MAPLKLAAWRARAYALVLAIVAAAAIHVQTDRHPDWGYDGYTYAIRMEMDAGIPYARARSSAQLFYAGKPELADPLRRHYLYAAYPQYWALFAPRIVYPLAASWLWPLAGMQALLIVSNLAFVAGILLLYALAMLYAAPEIAALVALSCCALPNVRSYGSGASTDMLAFAFLVAMIYAVCRYADSAKWPWFAAFTAAATLMSFTRPIAYVPLAAALVLVLAGIGAKNQRHVRLGLRIGAVSLLLCGALVAIGLAAHSPGLGEVVAQLRDSSAYLKTAPLWAWYAARVGYVTIRSIALAFALFAAPLSLVALWRWRTRADAVFFFGLVAASIPTILVNPIVGDIPRVVIFPLLPVFCCGLAIALSRGARGAV